MSTRHNVEAEPPVNAWEQVDLYRLFAYLFGPPTPDRFDQLRSPAFAQALDELRESFNCPNRLSGLGSFDDAKAYESAYIALFDVGLPEPPVPLLESAHNKTVPPQQIALENISFYEVLGLKPDPSQQAPDHLVTQLEFLAAVRYARENAPATSHESLRRLERDFLQRHLLNWLPAVEEKLRPLSPPVFPALATLLVAFLRDRFASLSEAEAV
jgi:DMSO reductase family type II enzyme chaperone